MSELNQKRIIKSDDYAGKHINNSYSNAKKDVAINPNQIITDLNQKLEKGTITEELYGKAAEQLETIITKGKLPYKRSGESGKYSYELTKK